MTELRTSSRSERPCAGIEDTLEASIGTGGRGEQRHRKVHSLIDKVYDRTNLTEAWEHVRENKGSAGIDGLTIAAFTEREDELLARLHATLQHNAHRTKEREVLYPWHPWFGQVVFVHETMKRGGAGVLRCSQSSEEGARCLETPEWMFDRAVCCGMVRGDSPRVSRAALARLKALICGGFGGSKGEVIEARSYSLSQRGRCAIWIAFISCAGSVSSSQSRQSEAGLVATPGGNARKGSAPDHAPARRAKEGAGSRPGGPRAER
jgi:hypothetical protein